MNHHSKRQELAGQRAEKQRLAPFMRALKAIHSATTPEVMNVEDLTRQRKSQELLGRLVAPMGGMSWEPFSLGEMSCAWIRPHRSYDRRKAVLYCHGALRMRAPDGFCDLRAGKAERHQRDNGVFVVLRNGR